MPENANIGLGIQFDEAAFNAQIEKILTNTEKNFQGVGKSIGSSFTKAIPEAQKTSRSLEDITKQRLVREEQAQKLSFKTLETAYKSHSSAVVDLRTKLSEESSKIERSRIQKQLKDEQDFTAVLRKEYTKRAEVSQGGAGAGLGILGVGRNIIGSTSLGNYLGAAGAATAIGTGLEHAVASAARFEKSMVDLSTETGVQGKALDELGNHIREVALKYNTELPDAVAATKTILLSLGDEFRSNAGATAQATESVLKLAKAQGVDASVASEALTTTLHQFGLATGTASQQAGNLEKIANVLAAAARTGTAKFAELKESMNSFGIVAQNSGNSVERTAAQLEVLSKEGIKGGDAGTKLNQVFLKMSEGTPIAEKALARLHLTFKDINPNIVGSSEAFSILKERLDKVENPVNRAGILMDIFSRRATTTATALINNADALKEVEKQLTNTNAATEQANEKLLTTAEQWAHAKAEAEEFGVYIGTKLLPIVTDATKGLVLLAKDVRDIFKFDPKQIAGENLKKQLTGFLKSDIESMKADKSLTIYDKRNELSAIFTKFGEENRVYDLKLQKELADIFKEQIDSLDEIVPTGTTGKKNASNPNSHEGDAIGKQKTAEQLSQEQFQKDKLASEAKYNRDYIALEQDFISGRIKNTQVFNNVDFVLKEQQYQRDLKAVQDYYARLHKAVDENDADLLRIKKDHYARLDAEVTAINTAAQKEADEWITNLKAYSDRDYALISERTKAKRELTQTEIKDARNSSDAQKQILLENELYKEKLEDERLSHEKNVQENIARIKSFNPSATASDIQADPLTALENNRYQLALDNLSVLHKEAIDKLQSTGDEFEGIVSKTFSSALEQTENQFFEPLIKNFQKVGSLGGQILGGLARSLLSGLTKEASDSIIKSLFHPSSSGVPSKLDIAGIISAVSGGYSSGGYTGDGARMQPAGIVHKGEGVLSQSDIAALGGESGFNALRRGLKGYDDGGVVGAPNYFETESERLLREQREKEASKKLAENKKYEDEHPILQKQNQFERPRDFSAAARGGQDLENQQAAVGYGLVKGGVDAVKTVYDVLNPISGISAIGRTFNGGKRTDIFGQVDNAIDSRIEGTGHESLGKLGEVAGEFVVLSTALKTFEEGLEALKIPFTELSAAKVGEYGHYAKTGGGIIEGIKIALAPEKALAEETKQTQILNQIKDSSAKTQTNTAKTSQEIPNTSSSGTNQIPIQPDSKDFIGPPDPNATTSISTQQAIGAAQVGGNIINQLQSKKKITGDDVLKDAGSIASLFPGVGTAIGAGLNILGSVLHFASGGKPPIGVPYKVGEKGAEYRVDYLPGMIYPNDTKFSSHSNNNNEVHSAIKELTSAYRENKVAIPVNEMRRATTRSQTIVNSRSY